jgi:hypothetical protein
MALSGKQKNKILAELANAVIGLKEKYEEFLLMAEDADDEEFSYELEEAFSDLMEEWDLK